MKLNQLAHNDELTGIANRREFIKQITELCENVKQNIHLVLIDIDNILNS